MRKRSTSQAPEKLEDVQDKFLECRDLKHAWVWSADFTPYKSEKKIVSMTRLIECSRCGAARFDEFAVPSMEKVSSRYYPPVGYKIIGRHGQIPVGEVRREILARQKAKTWKKR